MALTPGVAIKILPAPAAHDADRLRRFEREARAIASLSHPHICQLYEIGPGNLVLEYIDGEPLRGPVAAPEAVRQAIQIVPPRRSRGHLCRSETYSVSR